MSELPEWPDEDAPEMFAGWDYQNARAEAAIARLKVAVPLLEKVYGQYALTLNINAREEALHEEIFHALESIGEIPRKSPPSSS